MKRSGKTLLPLTKVYYPCWNCGKKVEVEQRTITYRAFCEQCEKEYNEKKASDLKEYVRLKTIIMHERAMRILEKQKAEVYLYKEASEAVLEFAMQPGEKFSSSHEMVAAMELIRNHFKVKTQQSVGNYRVDFMLPELHVVLEVDGHLHKHSLVKDNERDIEIRKILGAEWEVVRISTKNIEENIDKLTDAIQAIANYKREVRRKHNGIIPEWYSARENNHYAKIIDKSFKRDFK
ncbi:hypothetical protein PACILC2_07110 [Paenibacillus cisolokensis]|uniref:DUF559 domain-containing protein n=1 Tax=Paenibacillus cisolokensis TaxID=1658519 RepID=A0ABQ4N1T6_9BACL|nr:DUF559 domain-containing protein [Paenibacillus cisolokensis]GIQ62143.1 hypothetical protein PACILC2_07110 [Paenibacillus cisolokensis]